MAPYARLAVAALALLTFSVAAVPGASAAICEKDPTPVWDFAMDCVEDAKDVECERVRWLGCDILGGPFCPLLGSAGCLA